MTCRNCGQEIKDGSSFCPYCGATQAVSPGNPWDAASGSAAPAWESPAGGGKKKKTGLFIGIGVAVLAVAAVVAASAAGIFSSPKGRVEKAMDKSIAAYAAAEEQMGLPDVGQWQKDQKLDQEFLLELKGINSDLVGYDLSGLDGLRLGVATVYNGEDRYMHLEVLANWAGEELLSLMLAAEDDTLYLSCDPFMGEGFYGVNTETLGADLLAMTGDDSVEDLSFNFFDLTELMQEKMDREELERELKSANKVLWEQVEVKKAGARTLNLNGTDTKTTAYQVLIPEEALEQYVDDLEDALSALDYYELYEEMFSAMGMPREEMEDFLEELEDMDVYGELTDGLRDLVDELGDLELEVCLSGGHLSAVAYEGEIYGTDLSLALYLGGGEEYVDDLSLELEADGQKLTLQSSGDHGGRSGAFTDETIIKGSMLGLASFKSEFRYEPKKSNDNFAWTLSIPSAGSLDMSGTLTAQRDSVALDLEDVSLNVMGMEVCSLAFYYTADRDVSPWRAEDVKIITQMDQTELMMLADEIQSNTEAWTERMESLLMSRLPAELFYDMMYF